MDFLSADSSLNFFFSSLFLITVSSPYAVSPLGAVTCVGFYHFHFFFFLIRKRKKGADYLSGPVAIGQIKIR